MQTVNAANEFITVTFDLNGGKLVSGKLLQHVEIGGTAATPIVSRAGYIFAGWEGEYYNVTSDCIITAIWLPMNFWAVLLDIAIYIAAIFGYAFLGVVCIVAPFVLFLCYGFIRRIIIPTVWSRIKYRINKIKQRKLKRIETKINKRKAKENKQTKTAGSTEGSN